MNPLLDLFLRQRAAGGGIMNGRKKFQGGGADHGKDKDADNDGVGGGQGGNKPNMADISGPVNTTTNTNTDTGGNGPSEEEGGGFLNTVGDFFTGLATPQNLTNVGLSMAVPGAGLALGILNALEASPLGQYMGEYDNSMIGPNPNQGGAMAAVDPLAQQAAQVASLTSNYDATQLAMFNDLVARGYPENYAASVVSAIGA